jgi:hypothetical protein
MLANRPALKTSLLCACGIAAASVIDIGTGWYVLIAGSILAALSFLLLVSRDEISLLLVPVIIIVSIGFIRYSVTKPENLPASHITKLELFDSFTTIHGWITERTDNYNGDVAVTVSPISIRSRGVEYSNVTGDVRIALTDPGLDAEYGDEVTASGMLVRPSSRRNPGRDGLPPLS